ncbi:MAG: hypothetical protein FJ297_01395 [Planctomycetes bacterium]|nr:hypothetical protein [Planctomycetota bacterium]
MVRFQPSDIETVDPRRRHVLILRNPKAGARDAGARTADVRDLLESRGFPTAEHTSLDAFTEAARQMMRDAVLRAVVSAGGDGTLATVVDRVPPGTPIGVFPLGTENLMSRYVGHPADPEALSRRIEGGRCAWLDAGLANGRPFLIMLGCGFDAEVVRRVHERRSGHIGRSTYLEPIVRAIRSYDYPELRVYCEGGKTTPAQWACRWAFVVNAPRYALGVNFAPAARCDDGRLDVRTFRRGSLFRGLAYLAAVAIRRHERLRDVVCESATSVRIEADRPVPFQLDGDPGGETPVDVRVAPRHWLLLVDPDPPH